MTITAELEKLALDYMYNEMIKPRIPAAAAALKSGAPRGRSGTLAESCAVFLSNSSDDKTAIVVMRCDPPQTAPYNTSKKTYAGADYANFTNARGATAGWWDRAVNAAAQGLVK